MEGLGDSLRKVLGKHGFPQDLSNEEICRLIDEQMDRSGKLERLVQTISLWGAQKLDHVSCNCFWCNNLGQLSEQLRSMTGLPVIRKHA